jgi:hypothetical protein
MADVEDISPPDAERPTEGDEAYNGLHTTKTAPVKGGVQLVCACGYISKVYERRGRALTAGYLHWMARGRMSRGRR